MRVMDVNKYDRYMNKVFPEMWKEAKPENDLMPAADWPAFLRKLQAAL